MAPSFYPEQHFGEMSVVDALLGLAAPPGAGSPSSHDNDDDDWEPTAADTPMDSLMAALQTLADVAGFDGEMEEDGAAAGCAFESTRAFL